MTFEEFMEDKTKTLRENFRNNFEYITELLSEAYELGFEAGENEKSEDADILADPFPNSIETEQPYVKQSQSKPIGMAKGTELMTMTSGVHPYHSEDYVNRVFYREGKFSVAKQGHRCYYDETDGQPMKVMGMVCQCQKCTATC
jgi:hypothetical protein